MKNLFKVIILLSLLFGFSVASNLDVNNTKVLQVGTKISPPFSMINPDGKWEGVSIELWQEIAKKLHLKYEFKKENLKTLINGVADKRLDVGIAALTITAKREKILDFSHSYHTSWLGIAVPKEEQNTLVIILNSIFSLKMLTIVLLMLLTLVVIGTLIWFAEKRKNPDTFDSNPIKGIGSAIWWVATTMTTLGNGSIRPKSFASKSIAMVWMFILLLAVSSVIATISSTLTVSKIGGLVTSKDDLTKGKIATIKDSTSDSYLKNRRIYPLYYKTIPDAMKALEKGKVDAIVYDKPILSYYIHHLHNNCMTLIDTRFKSQNYSIAVQEGNKELLEKINRALLEIIESPKWEEYLHKYGLR